MNAQDSAPLLVFEERRPPRRLLILISLLFLSALAHAVSFYILQVAYTPTVTLAPPPAEVTLLAPNSAENRALDRWLSITDPALMINPVGAGRDLDALTFHYIPSYASAPPAYRLIGLTPTAAPPAAGAIFDLAPLPPLVLPRTTSLASLPTAIHVDAALEALAPRPLPPLKSPPIAKPLDPTIFLVGVRPDGGAPFIFRESSSGNATADETAGAYLIQLAFSSTEGPAPWGRVTFFWGANLSPKEHP